MKENVREESRPIPYIMKAAMYIERHYDKLAPITRRISAIPIVAGRRLAMARRENHLKMPKHSRCKAAPLSMTKSKLIEAWRQNI